MKRMNTCGWIRGYLAKSLSTYAFLKHVVSTLANEFECKGSIEVRKASYIIHLGDLQICLSKPVCREAHTKGGYCLDRMILLELENAGLVYEYSRSQYIRYCHGIFFRRQNGTVY